MLIVGFGIAVLVVPPTISKSIQRTVRRRVGRLIQQNKKGDL